MFTMGTMTINVKDETLDMFRKTVAMELGVGKGKLGKAIEEALKKWVHEKEQRDIAKRQIKLMEKGFDMGRILIKSRDELYDRR